MLLSTKPSDEYWERARNYAQANGLADVEYVGPWSMFDLCAYEFKGRKQDGSTMSFDVLVPLGRSSWFESR